MVYTTLLSTLPDIEVFDMTMNLNRTVYVIWVVLNAYLFGHEVGEFVYNGDLGMLILMGLVFVVSVYLLVQTWSKETQAECGLN